MVKGRSKWMRKCVDIEEHVHTYKLDYRLVIDR